jgi:hypothetical protein
LVIGVVSWIIIANAIISDSHQTSPTFACLIEQRSGTSITCEHWRTRSSEAIKWEVEGFNGFNGQEREGEGDVDEARSVILSFRTSWKALRMTTKCGGGRVVSPATTRAAGEQGMNTSKSTTAY